ncbi:MAG TPA: PQQ-dependent sugar dehydrogenase [Candidatus Saccharimonadales bacterium]|nr:PQQ-dependent sugar dehydrogenase [Candidatus Saccharimonadales bacterium]
MLYKKWIVACCLLGWISLTTLSQAQITDLQLLSFTDSWKYNQTVSWDNTNWTAKNFDDAALPSGAGALALEANNTFVTSRANTILALGPLTYYFRTHFSFQGPLLGTSLTFSNMVDDGAVYYLNGVEINRLYLPVTPTPINYSTLATSHEATTFDVFTLSGPIVETNLVKGDNVLSVEVHQTAANSSDIVFGLALKAAVLDTNAPPTLKMPAAPPVLDYIAANAFPGLGFGAPVCITSPPGETNRLFVLDKAGRILVITNLASPNLTTFMNLSVVNSGESGLLGLAFHPGYASNGFFYVFYSVTATTTQGTNRLHQRVSRFQTTPGNPNQALASTEQVLFTQADPASNHNGGDLHFGPDGYLYISVGDGGVQYDGSGNSQRIDRDFFSAIMRLDVDKRPGNLLPNPHPANSTNYFIPADNPFIGRTIFNGIAVDPNNVRTEFYAVGFRNPYRFSFDPATGFLYCGDVGQDAWEEVDIIKKGGNYGWAYFEGTHTGFKSGIPAEPLIPPIQEYAHGSGPAQGNAVIGGVVYRGNRFSRLFGAYVFGDNTSGNVWQLRYDGTNTVPFQRIAGLPGLSAFGTDPSNSDVLMANVSDGNIYRLTYSSTGTGAPLPPTLFHTGAFTNLDDLTTQTSPLTPNTGVAPYEINVPFWSDNALKSRWFFMPTNAKMGFNASGNWTLPTGMAWVKHFDLQLTNGVPESSRRLETRILVKSTNGVYGVSYRWGNSVNNATLLPEEGMDEAFTIYDGGITRTQIWHYPSRTECNICHTPTGGYALGFNPPQLNRDILVGAAHTNQIEMLSKAGYFNSPVTNLNALRSLAAASDNSVSLEYRVRSYLAANCAQCHQPGGAGLGFWNANITNFTAQAGLIDGVLNNDYGDTNNRVIVPGSPSNSMMLRRISTRGPGQMPPLASSVLDINAINLLSAWITNDLPAYQTFGQWQVTWFGATNAPNAAAAFDADTDGAPNYSEYIAGTSPLDASDAWHASIISSNGVPVLSITQPANRAFEIQEASNLGSLSVWHFLDLPGNRPFYPSVARQLEVPLQPTNGQSFYRLKLSPP